MYNQNLLSNQAMVFKDFIITRPLEITLKKNLFDFANDQKLYNFHIGLKLSCAKLAN